MDILEMHRLFRTIGQQMGIQQVRGILPESIDRFLNLAINEKCRAVLTENSVINLGHKVSIFKNEIAPINALRTLYRESEITNLTFDSTNVFVVLGVWVKYNDSTAKCRIIDNIQLHDTLNDFCNKDSKKYPIVTIYEDDKLTFRVYTGNTEYNSLYLNYIKKPAIVKYNPDNHENDVDCDLPDYVHPEIVQLAVNKFFTSVGYTTPNNK